METFGRFCTKIKKEIDRAIAIRNEYYKKQKDYGNEILYRSRGT